MGLRKPAVRTVLKAAKRKHQEGKRNVADALAKKAGEIAGRHSMGAVISDIANTFKLPTHIVATAEAACLTVTQPPATRRRPANTA